MTYTVIQQGEREMYQCDKCKVVGSVLETIEKSFCHQRTSSWYRKEGKNEKKKRPSFKTQTSVKKFNSYKLKERDE